VVAFEELRPLIFAGFLFDFQGLKNFAVFLGNLRVVGRAIVNVAKDLQCFFMSTVFVQVAWRLGQAEDEDDNDLFD
jgi:hypothetical protein